MAQLAMATVLLSLVITSLANREPRVAPQRQSATLDCHGTQPAAVELIFVRPKDKMVFYLSVKT